MRRVTVSPLTSLAGRIAPVPAPGDVPGLPAGRLAPPLAWLQAAMGSTVRSPHLLLVAADHAVARAGVTSLPLDHGARTAELVRSGLHPVALLAEEQEVTVQVVAVSGSATVRTDAGHVSADPAAASNSQAASKPADTDLATAEEIAAALEHGAGVVAALAGAGTDLLILADTGAGATTTAALLVAAMTSTEPVRVTGRGHGIDDATWSTKLIAIRDGLRRGRPVGHDPVALLGAVGGPGPAVAAGALVSAAAAGIPVLLDGVTGLAAAMLAQRLAPRSADWCWPACSVSEPASGPALRALGRTPVLDLLLGRGEGVGGLLAVQALRTAQATLAF